MGGSEAKVRAPGLAGPAFTAWAAVGRLSSSWGRRGSLKPALQNALLVICFNDRSLAFKSYLVRSHSGLEMAREQFDKASEGIPAGGAGGHLCLEKEPSLLPAARLCNLLPFFYR